MIVLCRWWILLLVRERRHSEGHLVVMCGGELFADVNSIVMDLNSTVIDVKSAKRKVRRVSAC